MGEAQGEVEVQLTDIVIRQSAELLVFRFALAELLFATILIVYFFILRFLADGIPTVYAIDITFIFIIIFDILFRSSIILIITGQWVNRSYTFKTDRIIVSRGTFFPSEEDLNYNLIFKVDVKQSPLGKLLDYGTLVITTTDKKEINIADIADPKKYEKILEELLPTKAKLDFQLEKGGKQAEEEAKKKGSFKETSEGLTSRKKGGGGKKDGGS